jgi:hypothetical protein
MKNALTALLRWFSTSIDLGRGPDEGSGADTPEHRLRDMEERGRTLFLP